ARNSHSFVLIDALVREGMFCNPVQVIPLEIANLSPEEIPFYLEYAKLAVHTLDSAGKFPTFAAILTESRKIERSDFDHVAAECFKNFDSKYIAPQFRKELWGDLNPPPEDFSLRCFESAYKLPVPELDKDGLPTGKMVEVSLDVLPTLSKRQDYYLLCRYAAKELFAVSGGESREVRNLLAQLRVMFEQDNAIFSSYRKSGSVPKGGSDPRAKAKKEQQEREGRDVSSFDSLMKKQDKVEFTKLTRKFYKEKVISDKAADGGGILGNINSVIPHRSKADPEKIRRIADNIRQALADRRALRNTLDKTSDGEKCIRDVIRSRAEFLKNDDDRISRWLEQIENRML
ncbi:MAG: hypothetical protein J6R00_05730, partial [Lentisphaeria bacterium]|nr:hypothetical protein [Lentisphaeria bacterium]